MATIERSPLIVIVGPTASGKTSLAIRLASKYGGEIICADSRTVYRDMNIGTAKPLEAEMQGVPHWGLDLVTPGERYTVAAWQAYAQQKVAEIRQRNRQPIVVGGTGLYIDALVYDYEFPQEVDLAKRSQIESWSADELQEYCNKNNISVRGNSKNKRHLIRSIFHNGQVDKISRSSMENIYVVGITTEKHKLLHNSRVRTEQMFCDGLVDETERLGRKYGWDNEAMTGSAYSIVRQYLDGCLSLENAKFQLRQSDWQLARRQMTWFRRNPYIIWVDLTAAEQYLSDILVDQ